MGKIYTKEQYEEKYDGFVYPVFFDDFQGCDAEIVDSDMVGNVTVKIYLDEGCSLLQIPKVLFHVGMNGNKRKG